MGILEMDRTNQAKAIGFLAGALAEELCEKYNDKLEPNDAFHAGLRAYEKLIADPKFQVGHDLPRIADGKVEIN